MEGAGKAHGNFSLLCPGASAQKGRRMAAGDRLWKVPEESSGHLVSRELPAGLARLKRSQAPPREAVTSHAHSYTSHRAGPGSALD